jgi:dTDP-4-dehydrorhamnose reductase
MTRWLVTGAGGLLGTDLLAVLADRRPLDDIRAANRAILDVTDEAQVDDAVRGVDVVVNAAAWTDVDGAEAAEAAAFRVNAVGPALLARACRATGARLLQLSTDYVFAGQAVTPYSEDAPQDPRTAYGRTKAAGEWAVRAELPDQSWVLRTAWLYGWHGPNFVATIRRAAAERDELRVVDDQHGQPTWTVDLANRIVDVVEVDAPPGTYHATNAGVTTWHGLAKAVLRHAGDTTTRVVPCTTQEYPRPAPRPAWSVLGHDGWARAGLPSMRPWDEALAAALTLV